MPNVGLLFESKHLLQQPLSFLLAGNGVAKSCEGHCAMAFAAVQATLLVSCRSEIPPSLIAVCGDVLGP